MVKISIIKKSIVVSDFSEKFGPDIIDMLSNQWNFEEEGKKLRYEREFDSMFVYKIYKYISDLGEKISLDSKSGKLVEVHEIQLKNLQYAIEKSKKIRSGKFQLPLNDPRQGILKPYQTPSVTHSIELDYKVKNLERIRPCYLFGAYRKSKLEKTIKIKKCDGYPPYPLTPINKQ